MLQLSEIRQNKQDIINRLAVKKYNADNAIKQILEIDEQRKKIQHTLDTVLSQGNTLARQIGDLFKSGKTDEANKLKAQTAELKTKSKQLDEELAKIEKQLRGLLCVIPNPPHASVKDGDGAQDNELLFEVTKLPILNSNALPHWELASKYDLIDFESGCKITGSGFPVYKNKGARLVRALINFFLDEAVGAGYAEIQPPILVNEASAFGTGQLPDKDGQMYHVALDNLYLVPTAEVPVTNLYRDVILKEEELPIKMTAYTPCFRREAGSYGKDVKGLNRLHQFDKVEIVQIQHPEKSYETLEGMKSYVADLLQKLELPYRIVKLCGKEMGFANAMCYDFEVYSAVQQKWLEVSSVSNFESFQANRLKLRFKGGDKKPRLAHTLNGSALGMARTLAALLENNQTSNGIAVPKALQSYTGFEVIT